MENEVFKNNILNFYIAKIYGTNFVGICIRVVYVKLAVISVVQTIYVSVELY